MRAAEHRQAMTDFERSPRDANGNGNGALTVDSDGQCMDVRGVLHAAAPVAR